ncbi:alanine or glycine:cation symporter, AGCS family [Bacillus sp. 71mf]|nr:alanine or glycine:cation symporter, AGCS family [Bacillus sp. 71mf]SFT08828.1 alanine or glycine:cation symporter, AGCS family [Bacillus sp. 103mf]
MISILEKSVETKNNILWTYVIITMLIGLGLYFSFKLKFVQIRHLGEMAGKKGSVSFFQSFCISSAARIGIGNLAGEH